MALSLYRLGLLFLLSLRLPFSQWYFRNVQTVPEIIVAGMKANIPFSNYSSTKAKPWFDSKMLWSTQPVRWGFTFMSWHQDSSEANLSSWLASRNSAKFVFCLAKQSFLKQKCGELSASYSENYLRFMAAKGHIEFKTTLLLQSQFLAPEHWDEWEGRCSIRFLFFFLLKNTLPPVFPLYETFFFFFFP